jgi:hypothetical protein
LKNAFFTETLIFILGPLLMVAAVYVGSLVRVFCGADEELADHLSSTTKWRLALRKAASSSVGVAILVLYMLQPTLAKQFALVFACVKMGAGDADWFLMEDLHVRCWTTTHAGYIVGLGLPLLLLYVIGVPAAVFRILSKPDNQAKIQRIIAATRGTDDNSSEQQLAKKRHKKARQSLMGHVDFKEQGELPANSNNIDMLDPETLEFHRNYAFLFLGYHQDSYAWEVLVIVRKAVLSLIGGLCVGQANSGTVGPSAGVFGHGATRAAHALRGCTNEQL